MSPLRRSARARAQLLGLRSEPGDAPARPRGVPIVFFLAHPQFPELARVTCPFCSRPHWHRAVDALRVAPCARRMAEPGDAVYHLKPAQLMRVAR